MSGANNLSNNYSTVFAKSSLVIGFPYTFSLTNANNSVCVKVSKTPSQPIRRNLLKEIIYFIVTNRLQLVKLSLLLVLQ